MSQPPYDDDRPVRNGLLALVGVSLGVGLVVAIVALVGVHAVGLAGGSSGSGGPGSGETMSIPPYQKTTEAGGPLITLNTQGAAASKPSSAPKAPSSPSSSASKKPKKGQISLQALETTVPNFGKIDLSGTFPGGEGEILQVQRKTGSSWGDFAATVPVSNATFSTYIQTGLSGKNAFRVLDKTRGIASNPVVVTVR
ncbi:MAG: hypothetical protein FWE71_16470 [Nocardioidaceae bacterium]|nr:hypothetical protein [Nocardioidaceae bacterium]MCL2614726.1 hypothetical protein [Nocardioidaceae bacterium]